MLMPLTSISEMPYALLRDMVTKMLVEGRADVNTEGGINRMHFFRSSGYGTVGDRLERRCL